MTKREAQGPSTEERSTKSTTETAQGSDSSESKTLSVISNADKSTERTMKTLVLSPNAADNRRSLWGTDPGSWTRPDTTASWGILGTPTFVQSSRGAFLREETIAGTRTTFHPDPQTIRTWTKGEEGTERAKPKVKSEGDGSGESHNGPDGEDKLETRKMEGGGSGDNDNGEE
jgi:hypothetical protein